MSLFKARDWWSTWAGSGEDFDLGCLCIANIDNNTTPSGILISNNICCCLVDSRILLNIFYSCGFLYYTNFLKKCLLHVKMYGNVF